MCLLVDQTEQIIMELSVLTNGEHMIDNSAGVESFENGSLEQSHD